MEETQAADRTAPEWSTPAPGKRQESKTVAQPLHTEHNLDEIDPGDSLQERPTEHTEPQQENRTEPQENPQHALSSPQDHQGKQQDV